MGKELVKNEARKYTGNAFGLAEGVMGLFDGFEKKSDVGSSMEVSRWLGWPIILVVPCQNVGRSIIASIQGFIAEAGGDSNFTGIILNKVNNKSHGEYLLDSCSSLKIPVLLITSAVFSISAAAAFSILCLSKSNKISSSLKPNPYFVFIISNRIHPRYS